MSELILRNRQRTRRVNLPLLRRIARVLLERLLGLQRYELGVRLVARAEMIRLNRQFLNHEGSTDVITFDYHANARRARRLPRSVAAHCQARGDADPAIHGEIFICMDDAVAQARQFHTTWQSELIRYLAHGVLHLLGYEDLNPAARRRVKREENRLLRALARSFPFHRLAGSEPAAEGKSRTASHSAPVVNRGS